MKRPSSHFLFKRKTLSIDSTAATWRPSVSTDVVSATVDGHCVLGHRDRRDVYVLNRMASAIWTGYEEGIAPGTLGRDIAAATGADPRRVELDAWASLVNWTRAGLLFGAARATAPDGASGPLPRIGWNAERIYRVQDVTVAVRAPDAVLSRWIHPTLRAFEAPAADGVAGVAREDGTPVNAVACDWSAGEPGGAYRVIPPADGLQRLLTDPSAAPLVVEASAVSALADLAARVTWRVPA